MCEINPAQTKIYRLEVYTSDKKISRKNFEKEVTELLILAEMKLNESKFRFHIHEE